MQVYLLPEENLIPWREVENWKCIMCGKCCRTLDVPVTMDEERELKRYGNVLRKHNIGVYLKRINDRCIFYEEKCIIYPFRPIACKKYPFYFRKYGEKDSEFFDRGIKLHIYIDKECTGIGRGLAVEKILQLLLKEVF
jgi:hypothetical protein